MTDSLMHKDLAIGRWLQMTLAEQLGNIGSEISRAKKSKDTNEARFWGAVVRALELFDLTLADHRWKARLKELGRAREVFCDAVLGGEEYNSSLEDLIRYFDRFAIVARS
jgi:hypothetical protein